MKLLFYRLEPTSLLCGLKKGITSVASPLLRPGKIFRLSNYLTLPSTMLSRPRFSSCGLSISTPAPFSDELAKP
jgi:hypothetical protein